MSSPTLVIVPGSYSSSLSYYDWIKHIQRLYPTLPEPLVYDLRSASSGPPLPPPTMYDDANYFAEKISEIADAGTDIVLFAHSYGGVVAREAVKGHSKEERAMQGRKGGVVRLVYLSAVIPAPGQSLSEIASDLEFDFLQPVEEVSNLSQAPSCTFTCVLLQLTIICYLGIYGLLSAHHPDLCCPLLQRPPAS